MAGKDEKSAEEARLRLAKQLAAAREREADINERLAQSYDDLGDKLDDQIALMQEELRIMKLEEPHATEKLKQLREQILAEKELNKVKKDSIKAGEKIAEDLGGMIGLNKNFEDSMLGSVAAMLKSEEGMRAFGKQIKKTFSPSNIAYSMSLKFAQATWDLAKAQDSALVSFNQQTGASRLYGDELTSLESRMNKHGVTMDIANESMTSMVKNIKGLNKISKVNRTDIADTTALLDKFGVSADTTTGNIEFMTRTLGMGVAESTKYQRELFSLAQEVGMPPAEMADQFKSAGPKLAAFGKQAGKTFKKLSIAARNSGMEVEQLLNITEQFDTFEGAAESVGKLNALLGGPFLNSMEMVMETDPTERMKKLSDGLRDSGKSFDQMSYYERKAIASAAGLADVNELALVMAGNFDGMATEANMSSAEIQELAAQSKEFNSLQDELNQVMRTFAIEMKWVIEGLKSLAQWWQDLGPFWQKTILGVITVTAALIALASILSPIITAFASVASALGLFGSTAAASGKGIEEGSKGAAEGIKNISEAAKDGKSGLLTLSLVLLALGASIAMAAYGISFLVAEFAKMNAGQILASSVAIVAFGFAMATMIGSVSALIAGPQAALVAGAVGVILAVGFAALMAGFGVSLLVNSLTGFLNVLTPEKMGLAVVGLWSLIGALTVAAMGSYAMIILAGAISLVGLALYSIDSEKIASMANLFQRMNEVTSETADNILKIGAGMGMIGAGAMLTSGAMLLNPLTALALIPGAALVGTGKAVVDKAHGAGSTSTAASQSPTTQKVVVEIKCDPLFKRYFTADVQEAAAKPLNTNSGTPSIA